MVEPARELLVLVLDPDRYQQRIGRLREFVTVTQLAPPALATVVVRTGQEVPDLPGTTFHPGEIPPDVVNGLPPAARVFAQAWNTRRRPEHRPGDHRPWDTPGRTPPS